MSLPNPRLLISLLAAALPLAAGAQSAQATDPQLILTRTVEPRVAYTALPRATDNPVAVQAPVFPGVAFGSAMDGLVAQHVDDKVLGALGAGGLVNTGDPRSAKFMPAGLALGPTAQGTAPTGLSGPGGAIGHATSGIGDVVTSTLAQALGGLGGHP
ncbi:hypothetical protein [Cognatilysobacter segetis]|uniref:hypothetical protein n=2 Tax=Cognatilysobacter segetis TaxID=2492394 RepID=UPI00105F050B|nr:hypothetical protein [Lysobacter segetis]